MNPQYLMENVGESERLLIKSEEETTKHQLKLTGMDKLKKKNPIIVDAGCGAGFVSKIMKSILEKNYEKSTLIPLDFSDERLLEASKHIGKSKKVDIKPLKSVLENIDLPDESVDYVFSRFVFEYLKDPIPCFKELKRILKKGGKMVIGDLDYNCLTHYPLDDSSNKKLMDIAFRLVDLKLIDPFMGRKLYHYFYSERLDKIKVHFLPHHLFYGGLHPKDEFNWIAKFDQMIKLQKKNVLKVDFDISEFKDEFLKKVKSEENFSYTPLIIVEGIK